jgi:hypothetical protein
MFLSSMKYYVCPIHLLGNSGISFGICPFFVFICIFIIFCILFHVLNVIFIGIPLKSFVKYLRFFPNVYIYTLCSNVLSSCSGSILSFCSCVVGVFPDWVRVAFIAQWCVFITLFFIFCLSYSCAMCFNIEISAFC